MCTLQKSDDELLYINRTEYLYGWRTRYTTNKEFFWFSMNVYACLFLLLVFVRFFTNLCIVHVNV